MKYFTKLSVFAFVSLLIFNSCSTESVIDIEPEPDSIVDEALIADSKELIYEAKDIEIKVLDLINIYRTSIGLNVLESMNIIKSVAFSHTDYMVTTGDVSHHNFHKRFEYLETNAGAKRVSENVAYGYTTAELVVQAWIKSESHKENIEGDYSNFDISAEVDADGRWYYTIIFMKK